MVRSDFHSRELESVIQGQVVCDGAGIKLLRLLKHEQQERLDPFLLLDGFRLDESSEYISGFPDHPHCGLETVTYLLQGKLHHRDCAGNKGTLDAGGVQWITAGRGLIHSEIPEQTESQLKGFQLWINLPAKQKQCKARLCNIPAARIPVYLSPSGNQIRIISGSYDGQAGAMQRPVTEPLYLDINLKGGSDEQITIPVTHNALIHVYAGSIRLGDRQQSLQIHQMAVLETRSDTDGITIHAETDARLLLIAGKPLQEPIAQWGPFVMNNKAQIDEVIEEYRSGQFGKNVA